MNTLDHQYGMTMALIVRKYGEDRLLAIARRGEERLQKKHLTLNTYRKQLREAC